MNDFASETDSEYTNYWKDWVGHDLYVANVPCTCLVLV